MISVNASGSSPGMEKSLYKMQKFDARAILDRAGRQGVAALASVTPEDSGLTANSWEYEIVYQRRRWYIYWNNTNVHDGTPIAILLQYGHGTGTGGYVQGRDYINPVIRPLFDKIAADLWNEVKNA
jgi:hypothetical protein